MSFAQKWADLTGGYVIGLAGVANSENPYDAKTSYYDLDDSYGKTMRIEGSMHYPTMSDMFPGQWNLYRPNTTAINANSVIDAAEAVDRLPNLSDIESLIK